MVVVLATLDDNASFVVVFVVGVLLPLLVGAMFIIGCYELWNAGFKSFGVFGAMKDVKGILGHVAAVNTKKERKSIPALICCERGVR